jgi:hypothetical protein
VVPAPPARPVQLCGGCGRLPGHSGEQAADLVAGQPDQLLIAGVAGAGLLARTPDTNGTMIGRRVKSGACAGLRGSALRRLRLPTWA